MIFSHKTHTNTTPIISGIIGKNDNKNAVLTLSTFLTRSTSCNGIIIGNSQATISLISHYLTQLPRFEPKRLIIDVLTNHKAQMLADVNETSGLHYFEFNENNYELVATKLNHILEEIMRRNKLFDSLSPKIARRIIKSVTDRVSIDSYNENVSLEDRIPEILVVIDDFNMLIDSDNKYTSQIKDVIDHIVKWGNVFGVHLLILSPENMEDDNFYQIVFANTTARIISSPTNLHQFIYNKQTINTPTNSN